VSVSADRDTASRGDRRPLRGGGLYLHVPFCASRCDYCRFATTDRHDAELRRRVVRATAAELDLRRESCPRLAGFAVDTAYVGGGTPSLLAPDDFADLMAGTLGRLPLRAGAEVTAEANPESLDQDRCAAWRDVGVGRVSLGVQSLDDAVLRRLGRRCDAATARAALALAGRRFPRVSADWILAPGIDPERLAEEFREARDLGVGHVSFYILEVHDGTPLADRIAAGEEREPAEAEVERDYLAAVEALAALGFAQYEVANFALPGEESRHNSAYWRRTPYLGLGPGAHGLLGARRYANLADPGAWLRAVGAGELPEAMSDPLDRRALRLERMILPLRTVAGVPLVRVPLAEAALAEGEREGLWRRRAGRLRLTPRGFLRLDAVEERLARAD